MNTFIKNFHLFVFPLCALAGVLFSGCARNISSDMYQADTVGESIQTYEAQVVSVQQVTVKDSERFQDNLLGMGLGGLGGGILGHQFGKGKGKTVGTVAGAGLGALAGGYAQDKLTTQQALKYVVEVTENGFPTGRRYTVVQGPNPAFRVGEPVWLEMTSRGRSRVTRR